MAINTKPAGSTPFERRMARSMLALLVIDLEYEEAPVYEKDPIRHQFAWEFCRSALPPGDFDRTIEKCIKSAECEKATTGGKQS